MLTFDISSLEDRPRLRPWQRLPRERCAICARRAKFYSTGLHLGDPFVDGLKVILPATRGETLLSCEACRDAVSNLLMDSGHDSAHGSAFRDTWRFWFWLLHRSVRRKIGMPPAEDV